MSAGENLGQLRAKRAARINAAGAKFADEIVQEKSPTGSSVGFTPSRQTCVIDEVGVRNQCIANTLDRQREDQKGNPKL